MPLVYFTDDYEPLAHYGILGMKWGVRRYQNKDGSLTNAGEKRYGVTSAVKNRITDTKTIINNTKRMGGPVGVAKKAISASKTADQSKMIQNYKRGFKNIAINTAKGAASYAKKQASNRGAGKIIGTAIGARVARYGILTASGVAAGALIASGHPKVGQAVARIGSYSSRAIVGSSNIKNGAAIVGHVLNATENNRNQNRKK